MRYRITDQVTGQQVTCEDLDVYDTLADWYPDRPTDVDRAIRYLHDALSRGEDHTSLDNYLALTIQPRPQEES